MTLTDDRAALTLPALREAFPRLREWLERIAGEVAMPLRAAQQLLIAADEIFTNVASYAYPGGEGRVTAVAEYHRAEQAFYLHFFDEGVPFDPLQQAAPDTTAPLAERALGGLGLAVVKKMMDELIYERTGNRNHLTLVKRFSPETEARE